MHKTKRLILISLLSAISFILMFIKFPLPFLPPYLTIDFSDIPALLALFTVGPAGALAVEAIKNILNFLFTPADPVGPVANFLAGASFLLSIYFVSGRQLKHHLVPAFLVATLVMAAVMSILNYFVLLPLYGMIMNLEDIAANLKVIVSAGIIPFNVVKGLVVSVIFMLIARPLLPLLRRRF
ncbi:ECF transporter S component [Macrococcus equipercicus]|uniref:Riboflavin transporter n=1 Tax=Macrococcus equipercicus TaxID=69967 RepID=A0A9Q9BWW1_9STAP|nr:ECF transporter S component [Macrococcus equipercicus]UTH14882.1 ECF transporter S component [Macrococcus equipercicus]